MHPGTGYTEGSIESSLGQCRREQARQHSSRHDIFAAVNECLSTPLVLSEVILPRLCRALRWRCTIKIWERYRSPIVRSKRFTAT